MVPQGNFTSPADAAHTGVSPPSPCTDVLRLAAALARLAARRQKLADQVAETQGDTQ